MVGTPAPVTGLPREAVHRPSVGLWPREGWRWFGVTVYHDGRFWVILAEREEEGGCGRFAGLWAEPPEPEVRRVASWALRRGWTGAFRWRRRNIPSRGASNGVFGRPGRIVPPAAPDPGGPAGSEGAGASGPAKETGGDGGRRPEAALRGPTASQGLRPSGKGMTGGLRAPSFGQGLSSSARVSTWSVRGKKS